MISRDDRAAFDDQLRVRRRGRPRRSPERLPEPKVWASVQLPEHVYNALCRRAALDRRSLHGLMKEALSALAAYTPN